jgi:hypothetical protein
MMKMIVKLYKQPYLLLVGLLAFARSFFSFGS